MKYDPAIISVGLILGAIALYSAAISPMSKSMTETRAKLAESKIKLESINMGIRMREDVKKRTSELERKMVGCRSAWISPMLDSYSMRAKAFLDTMAREAGLTDVEYSEGSLRALPIPKAQLPQTRTARRSVRIKAHGDYAAAASFVLRAEAELPFLTLQAIKIVPTNGSTPELQEINLVLEWPCEGVVIK